MKFAITTDPSTGELRFIGSITKSDMEDLKLTEYDHSVLRIASKLSASDMLLSLSSLFRAYEREGLCTIEMQNGSKIVAVEDGRGPVRGQADADPIVG